MDEPISPEGLTVGICVRGQKWSEDAELRAPLFLTPVYYTVGPAQGYLPDPRQLSWRGS